MHVLIVLSLDERQRLDFCKRNDNCYQLRRVITKSECTVLFYDDIQYGADNFIISPSDNITAFGSAVSGSGGVTTELYGIYQSPINEVQ